GLTLLIYAPIYYFFSHLPWYLESLVLSYNSVFSSLYRYSICGLQIMLKCYHHFLHLGDEGSQFLLKRDTIISFQRLLNGYERRRIHLFVHHFGWLSEGFQYHLYQEGAGG